MTTPRSLRKITTGAVSEDENSGLLSFGGHLEVLRKMLIRIVALIIALACVIFCFKDETFHLLLAPKSSDFCTFTLLERLLRSLGIPFSMGSYDVPLISTELSSQFMNHITVSCILALLLASPYILCELFRFISPALYENEKRYSYIVAAIVYALFLLGLLMSYFILFPISFRFLATYQVDGSISSMITLDSYISTFAMLTFMMGVVFQLPVIVYILGKMGIIDSELMVKYRPYALVIIMVVAAIITPPDLFTLVLVTIPIYGLYEVGILVLRRQQRKHLISDSKG